MNEARELPFAEDLNYWKTSRQSPDQWLDKAEAAIEKYGGEITRRATAREHGREAVLLEFSLAGDTFRAIWPVLESRAGDREAARRQASTMLYHEVKSRAIRFAIQGARLAFLDMLVAPSGDLFASYFVGDLDEQVPRLLNAAAALEAKR